MQVVIEQSEPKYPLLQLHTPFVQYPCWLHQLVQVFLETVQNYSKLGQVREPVRALNVLVTPFSELRQVMEYDPMVNTMLEVPQV